MPRFRDFTDWPDPELAEAFRPRRVGTREGGPLPRFVADLPQRDPGGIANNIAEQNNALTVIDRRIAVDPVASGSQEDFYNPRSSRPTSAFLPVGSRSVLSEPSVNPKQNKKRSYAQEIGADGRVFNPTGFPKTIVGTYARVEASPRGGLRFRVPSRVFPCIQRTTRREVLFAKRLTGKGASSKSRRYKFSSKIGC